MKLKATFLYCEEEENVTFTKIFSGPHFEVGGYIYFCDFHEFLSNHRKLYVTNKEYI